MGHAAGLHWALCYDPRIPDIDLRTDGSQRLSTGSAKRTTLILLLAVSTLLGLLPWWFGRIGLPIHDFSFVVDGGWRVLQGQVPYRDFHTPHGPMTFWLLALAFRVFSARFGAALILVGLVNGAAALLAGLAVAHEGGRLRGLAACLVTGAWFAGPWAFPWPDALAMFFVLAAYTVLRLRMAPLAGRADWGGAAAMGALLCLAALSKQNIGVLGLLALGAMLFWQRRRPAELIACGAGFALTTGVFVAVMAAQGATPGLWEDMVVRGVGAGRLGAPVHKGGWLGFFTAGPVIATLLILTIAVVAAIRERATRPLHDVADIVGLLLVGLVTDFTSTSNHLTYLVFLGIAVVLLESRYLRALFSENLPARARAAVRIAVVTLLTAAGLAVTGSRVCLYFVFEPSDFDLGYRMRAPAFEPMRMDHGTGALLDDLAAELRDAPEESILVFPNATMLYMGSGRVAPQPYLYFVAGHSTFDRLDDERRMIEALEDAEVSRVLLLKDLQFPLDDVNYMLTFMPEVAEYLQRCFAEEERHPHHIWLRRSQPAPCFPSG